LAGNLVHLLRLFGIAAFSRQAVDRASRRERIKQMGQWRYVLIFGVLGPGLAFGLALITADLLDQLSHGWVFAIAKLVFLSVFFGCCQGARTWREEFPVPFPPNYPSLK
jgi:hypothetical protein